MIDLNTDISLKFHYRGKKLAISADGPEIASLDLNPVMPECRQNWINLFKIMAVSVSLLDVYKSACEVDAQLKANTTKGEMVMDVIRMPMTLRKALEKMMGEIKKMDGKYGNG